MRNSFLKSLVAIFATVSLSGAAMAQYAARRAPAVALHSEMRDAWEQKAGCGKRISAGNPEKVYVTGCSNDPQSQIFYTFGGDFMPFFTFYASSIVAWPGGEQWISSNGMMSNPDPMIDPGGFPGCVKEAGVGRSAANANGTWTWVLVCPKDPSARDFEIARRYDEGNNKGSYQPFPGAGVRIAVGFTDGVAWVVNSYGEIWRQNYCKGNDTDESVSSFCKGVSEGWERIPGCARSIANAGNNRVWAIGCDADANGNASILQYSGAGESGPITTSRWTRRAGRAKEIAVDSQGRPWVLLGDGTIWRWSGNVPAKGVALASDPAVPPGGQNPN